MWCKVRWRGVCIWMRHWTWLVNLLYWTSGCFTLHCYDYYCLTLPQIGIIEQPQMDVKYSDKGQHQEYLQSERCLHGIQRSVFSVPICLHYYCTSLFCPHVVDTSNTQGEFKIKTLFYLFNTTYTYLHILYIYILKLVKFDVFNSSPLWCWTLIIKNTVQNFQIYPLNVPFYSKFWWRRRVLCWQKWWKW